MQNKHYLKFKFKSIYTENSLKKTKPFSIITIYFQGVRMNVVRPGLAGHIMHRGREARNQRNENNLTNKKTHDVGTHHVNKNKKPPMDHSNNRTNVQRPATSSNITAKEVIKEIFRRLFSCGN